MIRGAMKCDGIAVGEANFSFMNSGGVVLEAKAAFVSTKTGYTFGWTKNAVWSPPTIEKLKELCALMEIDLGRIHLEEGGEPLTGVSAPTEGRGLGSMPKGGIGEEVGSV